MWLTLAQRKEKLEDKDCFSDFPVLSEPSLSLILTAV